MRKTRFRAADTDFIFRTKSYMRSSNSHPTECSYMVGRWVTSIEGNWGYY